MDIESSLIVLSRDPWILDIQLMILPWDPGYFGSWNSIVMSDHVLGRGIYLPVALLLQNETYTRI